jgi:hypothetical protein
MGVALSLRGAFGFGLQSTKGTFVEPTTWLPLMSGGRGAADTVALKRNYVTFDLADCNEYENRYYSAGAWAEGELRFPLVPGALTALLAWIQDRDSQGQGKWASVVIDCVNEAKKLTDVKVRRATLDLVRGEPAMCMLDVVGLRMEQGAQPNAVMPTAAPYVYREAAIQLTDAAGTLQEDANCERVRVVVDNVVEEPASGMRLTPSEAPQTLYNLAGLRCWGAFSRDFVDNTTYSKFCEGDEAAVQIGLARSGVSATVAMPRVLYTGSDLGLPGSHEHRIVEKVDFLALGSVDGLTPPVTLA